MYESSVDKMSTELSSFCANKTAWVKLSRPVSAEAGKHIPGDHTWSLGQATPWRRSKFSLGLDWLSQNTLTTNWGACELEQEVETWPGLRSVFSLFATLSRAVAFRGLFCSRSIMALSLFAVNRESNKWRCNGLEGKDITWKGAEVKSFWVGNASSVSGSEEKLNNEVIQVNWYLSLIKFWQKSFGVKGREKDVIRKFNRMIPKFIWKNKLERIVMKLLKGTSDEEIRMCPTGIFKQL